MEEYAPECVHRNINKQKYTNDEEQHEEPSVTYEVTRYFNIFKCGKNILNRLDVKYEKHAWPPQETNTTKRCWKILLTVMIVTMHHCPMRSFDKQSVKSRNKWKRKNAT